MNALACLLLLAAANRVQLVHDEVRVAPDKWGWVEVNLRQKPAAVIARYQVQAGGPEVRFALMRREDLGPLLEGLPHSTLMVDGPAHSGTVHYFVGNPGEYALVIDNRVETGKPARVELDVRLDFSEPPPYTGISPVRQLVVVALSFAFFFGVVTYSARRLWKVVKR
jgi:hypothetical protein